MLSPVHTIKVSCTSPAKKTRSKFSFTCSHYQSFLSNLYKKFHIVYNTSFWFSFLTGSTHPKSWRKKKQKFMKHIKICPELLKGETRRCEIHIHDHIHWLGRYLDVNMLDGCNNNRKVCHEIMSVRCQNQSGHSLGQGWRILLSDSSTFDIY